MRSLLVLLLQLILISCNNKNENYRTFANKVVKINDNYSGKKLLEAHC